MTSYVLNLDALKDAATKAGDVRPNGRLHLANIARRSGVDPGVISRITRGENKPSLRTLSQLAEAYRTTVDKFLRPD